MGELDGLRARMKAGAAVGLKLIGENLVGQAQRGAPIEEGTLRASGEVEVVDTHDGLELVVSFSTPYAARQHEELTWKHPKGGEPKYLETPFKAMHSRYDQFLAASIKKAI